MKIVLPCVISSISTNIPPGLLVIGTELLVIFFSADGGKLMLWFSSKASTGEARFPKNLSSLLSYFYFIY